MLLHQVKVPQVLHQHGLKGYSVRKKAIPPEPSNTFRLQFANTLLFFKCLSCENVEATSQYISLEVTFGGEICPPNGELTQTYC